MRISARYISSVLVASILPASVIGAVGIVLMQTTATPLVDSSSEALLSSARDQAVLEAEANAEKISGFLRGYQDDINSLRQQTELSISNYPKLTAPYLSDLYPDKDRAGLPGYGYVSEKYGAYANWDHRGYAGTAWIRQSVVSRAREDSAFRGKLSTLMYKIMPIVPAFQATFEQHKDSCELLWVVTTAGLDCSYPVDYEKYLIRNPEMNNLDESKENYVQDYDRAHNPTQSTRWTAPYIDYIKQKWMMSCIAPLYDGDEFIGTIGADVLLGSLTRSLQKLQSGKAGYVFMVSAEGVPLALPEQGILDLTWDAGQKASLLASLKDQTTTESAATEVAGRWPLQRNPNLPVRSAIERMMRDSHQTLLLQLSGEEKLLAFAPIKETGWRIGVVRPVAEIAEPINHVRSNLADTFQRSLVLFLSAAVLIALLAGTTGAILGYRTTHPIQQLIRSIDTVGRGGHWHEVTAGSRDELQLLADSVNRMVRAILDQEGRFRLIFDGANDAIFIQDATSGRILDVNQRMCEMYGYTREEARQTDIIALSSGVPPFTEAEIMQWIAKAGIGENPVFEWQARDRQGRLFWVEANMRKVNIAGHDSLIVVVRDIEERIKGKAALQAEKERLAVTLQSIGDAVIATDRNGRISLMNRVAEELTACSFEEANGQPLPSVFQVFNEQTRERCEDPALRVLSTGSTVALASHTVLLGRDGVERRISDSGAPIRDGEGNIVGVVLVFRDVSKELKLVRDIQRMAKLDSLAVMAGGIAHDFNNLLTAIVGNIGLAQLVLQDQDYEEASDRLADAEKAAFRARSLSLQLLTFAKGSAPIRSVTDLPALIQESADLALTGSNCRCRIQISTPLWPVNADSGQLNQVLNNLLLNALQAMPGGGEIVVAAENQILSSDAKIPVAPGPYVCVEVRDQGTGIPSDILGKIFDPFFTTKQKGNGLGLASVHSIIRNHDGHVRVTSTEGKGSVFSVLLPAIPDASSGKAESSLPTSIGTPKRILVLDDEPMICDMIRKLLESAGHSVTTVAEGQAALGLWGSALSSPQPFDLAILDLTIPGGMGGKEVLEHLKDLDPTVKAIASSGYATDPVMSRFTEYGFVARVAKPYQVRELLRVVDSV